MYCTVRVLCKFELNSYHPLNDDIMSSTVPSYCSYYCSRQLHAVSTVAIGLEYCTVMFSGFSITKRCLCKQQEDNLSNNMTTVWSQYSGLHYSTDIMISIISCKSCLNFDIPVLYCIKTCLTKMFYCSSLSSQLPIVCCRLQLSEASCGSFSKTSGRMDAKLASQIECYYSSSQ